jgi:hypothetical protein
MKRYLKSCIMVLPAVFSVSVFGWYQINWKLGISVGIKILAGRPFFLKGGLGPSKRGPKPTF